MVKHPILRKKVNVRTADFIRKILDHINDEISAFDFEFNPLPPVEVLLIFYKLHTRDNIGIIQVPFSAVACWPDIFSLQQPRQYHSSLKRENWYK